MSESFDVIVVGGGGSGLAAAVSAAQHGGRVLVVEKLPQLGGTTGIAVGSFTAAGTRWQRAKGIVDSIADHAVDAGRFAAAEIEARNNPALRQFFLSQAAETLEWLESLGLSFVGPHPEPPNRAPRMHNVVPSARAYVATLERELVRLHGKILLSAGVKPLLFEDGRVVGVIVAGRSDLESPREYRATCGVILAAGDYASAPDLIRRFKGNGYDAIEGINPFAGGDGQRLVEAAGGQLINMDVTYGPELRFVAPRATGLPAWLPSSGILARALAAAARMLPKWMLQSYIKRLVVTWQHPENALFDDGAILINSRGERFVNERRWPERELAVAQQPGKVAYVLLDGRLIKRYSAWPHFVSTAPDIAYAYVADYLRLRPDVAMRADKLADLMARARIARPEFQPDSHQQSIDQYNAYVGGQQADPFGRSGDNDQLASGPWLLLGPVKAYFTTTEGGAAIDQQFRVLNGQGQPIPGLFAVGQNGLGGMILWGHGLHIAWAMTSGRLAGQLVMQLRPG
jgi:fumarate reductase flavoprotein subunit